MGAYILDRIRTLCQKGQQPRDAITGGAPQINVSTDTQFEVAYQFLGSLIDASQVASVTLQIKSASNEDAAAIIQGTATPSSSGWNGNAVLTSGTQIVPSYALYSGSGTYTLGVQVGGTYTWTGGANEQSMTCNGVLITGSNIVIAGNYSGGGTASVTVSKNTYYYLVFGANDTSIQGITVGQPPFVYSGSNTSLALIGTPSVAVTAQIYPATIGQNLVGAGLSYPTSQTVASGSNLVPAGNYSAAVTGQPYGTYTLTGLTVGNTYLYSLGANEPSGIGGSVAGNTASTGTFTATTTSAILFGLPSASVTAQVYATTSAATTYSISGLTVGSTYYWTKGANDTYCGTSGFNASGFFIATSTQVALGGIGGASITAQLQLLSSTPTGTFVATANTVVFTGTASASVTASLTGTVGWNQNTDQLAIIPFTHLQTSLLTTTDGGTQPYWMLLTANMLNGDEVVLGAGTINAVDNGNAAAAFPVNIIPAGATYNSSGQYIASGLVSGGYYYWGQGANDTGCAGLTSSGNFIAAATTQLLTGTANAAVTATLAQVMTPAVQRGLVALPNGSGTVIAVTVSLPFLPTAVRAFCMAGATDAIIGAQVIASTITATGFSVQLDAGTQSANYKLVWVAFQ